MNGVVNAKSQREERKERRRERQANEHEQERATERHPRDLPRRDGHPRELEIALQVCPPARGVTVTGRSAQGGRRRVLGGSPQPPVREGLHAINDRRLRPSSEREQQQAHEQGEDETRQDG
jgi:hypothetical protein